MLQLDISSDEAAVLLGVLENDVSDLGYEIANTDSKEFRDNLKAKKEVLRRVIDQLSSE